jgi:hypothetical protein
MQIREKKYNFLANNQMFSFKEKLANWVQINTYVVFETEKFLDYQKDLLQDFLADFIDKANTKIYDEEDLKNNLEEWLQNLNVKLKLFADKVTDIKHFPIKWYMQIIAWDMLMTSMIGDTSVMIFRNKKLYYQLHNWVSKKAKIDTFSDFVEWDIESGDEITYAGTKISDVIDQSDIKEMESILQWDETSLVEFLEQALTSRVDQEKLWMLATYYIHGNLNTNVNNPVSWSKKWWKWIWKSLKINSAWTKKILTNKYYVTIAILSIVILFMLYNVLWQLLNTSNQSVFTTSSGTVIDITIEDIKKDIYMFQQMDPTSDQKWVKYNEIVEKLWMLEDKGRRLEDVESLKWIIQNDYYKGFNIIRLENLSQLDDPATGIKTRHIAFNPTEKEKLGDGLIINYERSINVWWTQWALIGAVNDGARWSLVEYAIEDTIKGCSSNLLRDGLYCYTIDGRIFSVTKAGIEPLITSDLWWFPDTVWWIWVYGKANLYVFQPNLHSSLSGTFVSRYRNTVWSQTSYQEGQNYAVTAGYESGMQLNSDFASMAIDSTFLTWESGKLYQLRRPGYGTLLDIREIKLMWWDQVTNKYSDDVKVIAYLNSKYVYLFDRTNQTFAAYTSKPLKTNDQYNTQYDLYYLFSFKFDLASEDVLDITISENSGNRPEMYILTTEWVNKVNLYEYIDSLVNDDALKAVTSASVE